MPEAIADPGSFGDISSLLNLIKQVTGTNSTSQTGTTTSNELSPESGALMTQLLGTLLPQVQSDQYSPEAATRDSQALVQQIMDKFTQENLPQIYQAQTNSGGYNSTTGQLMANDAKAKAAAAGAAEVASTKESYAKLQQGNMQQLVNVLLGLIAGTKKTNTQTNQTQNTGKVSPADLAKAALAAAAGKAAARDSKGGDKPGKAPPPKKTPDPKQDDPNNPSNDTANLQKAVDDATSDPNAPQAQPISDQDLTQQILDSANGISDVAPGGGDESLGLNTNFTSDGSAGSTSGDESAGLTMDNPFAASDFTDNGSDSIDTSSNLLDDLFGDNSSSSDNNSSDGTDTSTPDDGSFDFSNDSGDPMGDNGVTIIDDGGEDFS